MKTADANTVLLPTAYFGPVGYWACLMAFPNIIIEAHEHYVKQTIRNRTTILSESGPLSLTVPVSPPPVGAGFISPRKEGNSVGADFISAHKESNGVGSDFISARKNNVPKSKIPVCDIRISAHGNWPHLHLQALRAAYERSPFFEYYIDDLLPLYDNPAGQSLVNFNLRALNIICNLLDFHPRISLSTSYEAHPSCVDLRTPTFVCEPHFRPIPYYQVFQHKFGFTPNLSVLDLLFNMGPESLLMLRDCIVSYLPPFSGGQSATSQCRRTC